MNRAAAAAVVLLLAVLIYLALVHFIYSGLTCGGTGCP